MTYGRRATCRFHLSPIRHSAFHESWRLGSRPIAVGNSASLLEVLVVLSPQENCAPKTTRSRKKKAFSVNVRVPVAAQVAPTLIDVST